MPIYKIDKSINNIFYIFQDKKLLDIALNLGEEVKKIKSYNEWTGKYPSLSKKTTSLYNDLPNNLIGLILTISDIKHNTSYYLKRYPFIFDDLDVF